MQNQRQALIRFLRFNVVGALGVGVQLAILATLRSGLHLTYMIATALAVETAVLHNFLWHERYTWADRSSARTLQSLTRFAKFNASNGAVSLVGNLILMRVMAGVFGINYLVANLAAVGTCSVVNFLLSDRFVFESRPAAGNALEVPR